MSPGRAQPELRVAGAAANLHSLLGGGGTMVETPSWIFGLCAISGLLIVVAELAAPVPNQTSSIAMAVTGLLVLVCSLAGLLSKSQR